MWDIYCLKSNDGGNINFKIRKNELVGYESPEKYGDIISIPITLSDKTYIVIEPKDIKY